MMKKIFLIVIASIIFLGMNAQEDKKYGIKFSGFVKNDFFYDSRQTVAAREGHFLLWPSAKLLDNNNNDINAASSFNMLAIQSRLKGAISGPDAFGAKTSGVIEADFFAQANENISLLRMRHAFVKLNWKYLELLAGQYWNPLFITDCYPSTVSINTGVPFHSLARNPQIRATYKTDGGLKLTGAILSQRDHNSKGEVGASSSYLRNSGLPDMHLQFQYSKAPVSEAIKYTIGAGLAYKVIAPRLFSSPATSYSRGYKVKERVGGITALAFSKIEFVGITIKLQARYGENIADVLAPSGFAVKKVENTKTGELSYTPLKSLSFWGDIHSNGSIQFGIFGGFFRNLGTKEAISAKGNSIYGFGVDIHTLMRISPRVIINSGKTRVALEMEYTRAEFGKDFDTNHLPSSTSTVSNLRGLVAVYYFF